MDPKETKEARASGESAGAERRVAPRFVVDGPATLFILNQASTLPCRILDLSLSGCRIQTKAHFKPGHLVQVEVGFSVNGMQFRLGGVCQWASGRGQIGVRFSEIPMRRKEELLDLITEVREKAETTKAKTDEAAEASTNASSAAPVEGPPQAGGPRLVITPVAIAPKVNSKAPVAQAASGPATSAAPMSGPQLLATPVAAQSTAEAASESGANQHTPAPRLERRSQTRHEVDTSAMVYLIKIRSQIPGRIVDMSLNGCRIHTTDRFHVGVFTRVEVEFQLAGLPFRLAGVIQAIHGRQQIGIRFLDMSERKRKQVEILIAEIEAQEKRTAGENPESADEDNSTTDRSAQ